DLADESKFETWYDASDHRRHLNQKDLSIQPVFHIENGYHAVRFDGERQHLTLTGLGRSFKDLTIFLVTTPFTNEGVFRGFLALNQDGRNDYVSGLTIDQGPGFSQRLEWVNVEGAGFGGAVNLLRDGRDCGLLQRWCVTSAVGAGGTKLYVNGKLQGQRHRTESTLHMDRLTVGARFYTNGGPPEVRGFLDG